jgi:hypothetical protein
MVADGKETVQQHHLLGRANDDTTESAVTVPGNLHTHLTACQREWPEPIRRNVSRDPLLVTAAEQRAYADFSRFATLQFRRRSDYLIALRAALVERYGEHWWEEFDIGPLWA